MANNNLIQLIKRIAREERTAAAPCNFVLGRVVTVNPPEILIKDNLKVSSFFVVFSQSLMEKGIAPGDILILGREDGGQKYFAIDKKY